MGAGVLKSTRGGRRRGARTRHAAMSEINVTPFVDVMLVLLIIFMVAAPLMTVGVPLDLPKSAAQPVPAETEEPLVVSLTAEGGLALMNSEIPPEELIDRLRAVAAERESDKIYLRADGSLPYEEVVQVMGAMNAGGFTNIVLVTDTGGPAMAGGN
ncbi:ExbD/TolR family protein [Phaeovulum vinaykumarii]|uniref:Cell division and transport-associated protein TolR n=1 Tax=Phaeovulum vinaykumarii TaxID=407234 RepID=A0A1N7K433_9RHOB|nr:ExbD/TolR family protein [Phaeovulum vinaykumarii]SIS56306.1 Cell division and transport-associated protein TolR [Phaeovulum vinaykumarii]SOB92805.1 cell division and transport-associated protein TolR [Phaeovulum vinaykumarii]